ncbi:restriction endonuclease subunit S [uncultured Alistipes sp.]|uniref:restriction endonuclease subunit S n=6 Tax=Bacteroidia TaxID=200643 RepID=UPI00265B39B5|nr:restriction endonuclease subunit S [uncultured Alistipes sp.]
MAANKNNKALNVPHLRFPEFCGEWKDCSIQDYGEVVTGNTPPTSHAEYYENGTYLWASPADLGINKNITETKTKLSLSGFKKTKNIPKGSVLVTCIGSTIGKMGMATETMASNQQINSIVVNDKSNCDFVYYAICRAFPRYLAEVGVQAVPILSKSNFEKLPNYTTCREEQDKIGYFLNLLDERIATQNKIIEKLETLIKGIVDFIFTYYKFTTIPFKDVYSCAGEGGTPATSNPEYYKSGTIPFIKIDDLQNKYIESNKDYITELGLQKSSAWIVPTNSIIYSNGATIGKVSINKYPVCTKQGILGIAPKANMNVEFLYYFMTSTMFAKAIERVVTEGTMRTAYLKDINHILCPIPNSNEQNKIAKLLSALSAKLENEIIFQRKLQKQKEFLLSQMFI